LSALGLHTHAAKLADDEARGGHSLHAVSEICAFKVENVPSVQLSHTLLPATVLKVPASPPWHLMALLRV